MAIFRKLAIAGAALALLLFLSNAFLAPGESHSIATSGSWKGADSAVAERRSSSDVTPQERIRDAFAQFTPQSGRAI
jgi:hypothetical protein